MMNPAAVSEPFGADTLIPVAVMAHNEEKVIRQALESVLTQRMPAGQRVQTIVAANACTDGTEAIVQDLESRNSGRIRLLSLREKGKTRAINAVIGYLAAISSQGVSIPFVVFLDADCVFDGPGVLERFAALFRENPGLCAIGANTTPDVAYDSRTDCVAALYRSLHWIDQRRWVNSISGMCYGIRMETLTRIDFPELQFAEDMYLTSRVDGRFLKSREVNVVFRTPALLRSEIRKRVRQEISTRRYLMYHDHLTRQGVPVRLYDTPLGPGYTWGGRSQGELLRLTLASRNLEKILSLAGYFLIRGYAIIAAALKMRAMKGLEGPDYWTVVR